MTKRQSRSAAFIGKIWGLGKTGSDPLAARSSQLEAAQRWTVILKRDLPRFSEATESLGAQIAQLRRERDPIRWRALYGELIARHEALEQLLARLRSTDEKLDSVRSRFEGDGSIAEEVPLWRLAHELTARIEKLPPLRKLPDFTPPKGAADTRKAIPPATATSQNADSLQESDFASKLRRAIATAEGKTTDHR